MDPSLVRLTVIVGLIAAVGVFGSAVMFLTGFRLARRLERQEDEVAELRGRLEAAEEVHRRLSDLETRVDFAERRLLGPHAPVGDRKGA